ncbi:MAG: hypothetical protein J7K81_03815, partial [Methanophagales archaeon]|nr:hypothetical protein [Methanophagales archaeon]
FKGEWVQGITEEMSEETGMYMLRSLGGCGGFPIDLLPEEVPSEVIIAIPYPYYEEHWSIPYRENAFIIGVVVIIALIVGIGGFVLYKKKRG